MRASLRLRMLSCLCAHLLACAGTPEEPGGPGGPGGGADAGGGPVDPAWRITVDMSGLDRYVTGGATTWPAAGKATASLGLAGVDVAGAPAQVDGAGAFGAQVAAGAGLTVVSVVARDNKGNERQAHRTLLSAAYHPEGAFARDAAALVLTDELLAAMAEPLAGDAASIDVAGEIAARPTLSVDDQCTTWPIYAEQDPTAVSLDGDGGELWLNIRVPNLYVAFEGECDGLFSTIPIAGEIYMTVDAWSLLAANPAAECVRGFAHTTPEVMLLDFTFDVWGTGGPLAGWMVELSSSGKAEEVYQQFQSEIGARADEELDARLADLVVFDRQETMTLLGQAVEVHLCLASLESAGGELIASIGSTTTAAGGTLAAPGAPQLGGPLAAAAPGELLLDADLVGRLLFSSWRAGGLSVPGAQEVDFLLLSLIARDLVGLYPDDARVSVSIHGELPPLASVSPVAGADLRIDIGDLMVDLHIGEDHLFLFGARITLDLDLVPMDGGLVPTVVQTSSEVHLLDEIVDGDDGALEAAVDSRLADSASSLLAGATLTLPEIPGLGAPATVAPDPSGRYLRIAMH